MAIDSLTRTQVYQQNPVTNRVVAVVVVVGALSFFPALALGPIVEHLMLPA